MRPPPAAAPYRTWAEQVIPDPAAVTTAERLALDAGAAGALTEDPRKGETVTVSNTQYADDDAELTIGDARSRCCAGPPP